LSKLRGEEGAVVRYESRVAVDRPPEVVFAFLIEPAKQALWSDVPMQKVTDGPFMPGSRMEVTFGKGPISATLGLELTSVEPGRRLAWTSYSGPLRWQGEYRLEPSGNGGTELRQEGTIVFTGLWRLLEPLFGAEIKSGEIKELEKLKAAAEAG
jgi:uncharacterized protein YndB with AHSA1/START domain